MRSILKTDKIVLDIIKPFSIKKFVDYQSLRKKINDNNSLFLNKNRINKINGLYHIKNMKNLNPLLKSFLSLDIEYGKYFKYIEPLMLNKEIIVNKIDDVIFVVYIDLFLNYYILKDKRKKVEDISNELKRMSETVNLEVILKSSKDSISGGSWKQSTLLETALGSIEWSRDGRKEYISYNANKYLNEINAKLVEIPKNYEKNKLEESLLYILNTLNKFEIKNRDFILRFRKIKKIKREGLFIKSANTIILDPRDISAFQHELGHFVYENNVNFKNGLLISSDLFCNIVKENYIKYKENLKMHKVEDYKESSEIFALYFEGLK